MTQRIYRLSTSGSNYLLKIHGYEDVSHLSENSGKWLFYAKFMVKAVYFYTKTFKN